MEQQPKAQITIHPRSEMSDIGRSYVAVLNGKVVGSHFCSHDGWAQQDLGAQSYNRPKYEELCPNGFEVKFSSDIWRENENG